MAISITHPEFLTLDRESQNQLIEAAIRSGRLIPTFIEALQQLPWNPESARYQELWQGLHALQVFEQRIDPLLVRPHVRVFASIVDAYRREVAPPEAVEEPDEIWAGFGAESPKSGESAQLWAALYSQIIRNAGPRDWERAFGLAQAVRGLAQRLTPEWVYRLASMPAAVVLASRANRSPLDIWRDVWNRTSYHASDLFYHDSRLRRALLDRNVEHASRLMAVLAKAGRKPSDLVGAVVRAAYDIDYSDDLATLGLLAGATGILEASPMIGAELFRSGVAKLLWDLAHEPIRPHERIFYDEISLIKSREIIIDFRKATLRSDFTQSWGFAEYAFVHGFEALEIFDEVSRLSPSFHRGGPALLPVWKHLAAVESLLKLLPEDYGIYVMAHTVRLISRVPKDVQLLDPFPDEEQ